MKTQIRQTVTMVSSIAIVCFLLLLTGCSQDNELLIPETENQVLTGQGEENLVEVKAEAPWEKVRYDYSYLETGVAQANQYLTTQKLTLEDLKQLHDIGNIVFGDYVKTIYEKFDERSEKMMNDMMDDDLFFAPEVKKKVYGLLMSDFLSMNYELASNLEKAPYIHIHTNHIGERNGFIFIPFSVYDLGIESIGKLPADFIYYTLQLKKADNKFGWQIYYAAQAGGYQLKGYREEPFLIRFSENDVFNKAVLEAMVPDEEDWKYYVGEEHYTRESKDNRVPEGISRHTCSSSHYDRKAAATYAYHHANNYNLEYHNFTPNDCANFVSQCLKEGGLQTDNVWYYNKKNSWECKIWVSCNKLFDYLINNGYGEIVATKTMADVCKGGKDVSCDLRWGDLIFMKEGTDLVDETGKKKIRKATHVMIVNHSYHDTNKYYTGYPKYLLSGHTTDRLDVAITSLYKIDFWRMNAIGVKITYGLA